MKPTSKGCKKKRETCKETANDGQVGEHRLDEEQICGRMNRSVVRSVFGGLAQLGERLAGSQKVIGSSPLSSIDYLA